jgi:hypothetical protein
MKQLAPGRVLRNKTGLGFFTVQSVERVNGVAIAVGLRTGHRGGLAVWPAAAVHSAFLLIDATNSGERDA